MFYEEKDEPELLTILLTLLRPAETTVSMWFHSLIVIRSPEQCNSVAAQCISEWKREPISIRSFITTRVGCGPIRLAFPVCFQNTENQLNHPLLLEPNFFMNRSFSSALRFTPEPSPHFKFSSCDTAGRIICCSDELLSHKNFTSRKYCMFS